MSRKVWWNGEFVDEADAKVSIYDSALMFGDVVFEMTRSFNKVQFKLDDHLERLFSSMKYVHIDIPYTIEQIKDAVHNTVEANDPYFTEDDEHRIMINVTRGLLGFYQDIDGLNSGPNVIIADFPLRWTVSDMGRLFDSGINAVIPSQRAIPASLLEPKVKNRSRIHYMMANIEVSRMIGSDNWALLLDPDGYITEGTGDNFFIVKDGVVITPEGRNILRGISRGYIFELCKELDIPCIETNIEPYDVMNADEAFMTATPFCMLPVTRFNYDQIGNGGMGHYTSMLLSQWSRNVGVDIESQIKSYGDVNYNRGTTVYSFGDDQ